MKEYENLCYFEGRTRSQRVSILSTEAGKMIVSAATDRPDTLVFAEVSYPGWQVAVDGQEKPAALFEDTFLAVNIPAGKHEVEFQYVPRSFRVGALFSAATALLMMVFSLFPLLSGLKSR